MILGIRCSGAARAWPWCGDLVTTALRKLRKPGGNSKVFSRKDTECGSNNAMFATNFPGNGKFTPSIFGDLGDGLWHCCNHMYPLMSDFGRLAHASFHVTLMCRIGLGWEWGDVFPCRWIDVPYVPSAWWMDGFEIFGWCRWYGRRIHVCHICQHLPSIYNKC